jgi:hypothetical protein
MSPYLAEALELKPDSLVKWRFVDPLTIPPGPWKRRESYVPPQYRSSTLQVAFRGGILNPPDKNIIFPWEQVSNLE